ncbi:uncharacterized protein A4U43_C08F29180 [Asparagus officinalis]|nr:uncharacterized protein A4U43_C08F29180 [Asparagus officinalis]
MGKSGSKASRRPTAWRVRRAQAQAHPDDKAPPGLPRHGCGSYRDGVLLGCRQCPSSISGEGRRRGHKLSSSDFGSCDKIADGVWRRFNGPYRHSRRMAGKSRP